MKKTYEQDFYLWKVFLENIFTELCAVLGMASIGIKRVIWLTANMTTPLNSKVCQFVELHILTPLFDNFYICNNTGVCHNCSVITEFLTVKHYCVTLYPNTAPLYMRAFLS